MSSSNSSCTLFSVSDDELAVALAGGAPDDELPAYDEASSRMSKAAPQDTLELGRTWAGLHAALGGHGGDHPLGFLVTGGADVAALADGPRSSGRAFTSRALAPILAALSALPARDLAAAGPEIALAAARLRGFLTEIADAGRGLIVHRFVG
jgi:hypothetical protein